MLKNDTLKNGTSRIGIWKCPPGVDILLVFSTNFDRFLSSMAHFKAHTEQIKNILNRFISLH